MTLTEAVNLIFSTLTVAGQVIIILNLVVIFFFRKSGYAGIVSGRVLFFSFVVALTAMTGSLIYSDVIGYEPCKLCWFQRIFMYPQVFLLALALWRKDRAIIDYAAFLSVFGAIIAGYHYLLQLEIAPDLSCGAVGYSVSCAQRFVMNFGYITLPLMALTAFLTILTFFLVDRKYKNS